LQKASEISLNIILSTPMFVTPQNTDR